MRFNTTELRNNFLVDELFKADQPKLVYSFDDRLIIGGIRPLKPVALKVSPQFTGTEYLLERRELGLINIGDEGSVVADGKKYKLGNCEGLYIGKGTKSIIFGSSDNHKPAKFYLNSAPAHRPFPTTKITIADSEPFTHGRAENSNHRTICKYIHPGGVKSCQLLMGLTMLERGSIWNTMPVHTHQRRTGNYLYFNMDDDDVVFHFIGKPEETRHLVMRNGEAVLSPSWSIHSGAGIASYSVIWGMVGENQDFRDMDHIPLSQLR